MVKQVERTPYPNNRCHLIASWTGQWPSQNELIPCYNGAMMGTVRLTIEIPHDILLSTINQDPEGFLREMRSAAAVKWFETEQNSQSRAAEIAGLSRAEFLASLGRFGVSPFQATSDDLMQETNHG